MIQDTHIFDRNTNLEAQWQERKDVLELTVGSLSKQGGRTQKGFCGKMGFGSFDYGGSLVPNLITSTGERLSSFGVNGYFDFYMTCTADTANPPTYGTDYIKNTYKCTVEYSGKTYEFRCERGSSFQSSASEFAKVLSAAPIGAKMLVRFEPL